MELTNQETGEVWESGKRGRKPKWVIDLLQKEGIVIESKIQPKIIQKITEREGNRIWKWNSLDGHPHCLCLVVAETRLSAIMTLNKTMKFPVSSSEFTNLWVEMHDERYFECVDTTRSGVWEKTDEHWIQRKELI